MIFLDFIRRGTQIRRRGFSTRWKNYFFLFLISVFSIGAIPAHGTQENFHELCSNLLGRLTKQGDYPATLDTVKALLDFATEHNLPVQILGRGPNERKIERVFVGLNVNDPALLEAYRKKFTLDGKLGEHAAGTLVLEFQYEVPNQYVTGVLRTGAEPATQIYRWGRPDQQLSQWWDSFMMDPANQSVLQKNSQLIQQAGPPILRRSLPPSINTAIQSFIEPLSRVASKTLGLNQQEIAAALQAPMQAPEFTQAIANVPDEFKPLANQALAQFKQQAQDQAQYALYYIGQRTITRPEFAEALSRVQENYRPTIQNNAAQILDQNPALVGKAPHERTAAILDLAEKATAQIPEDARPAARAALQKALELGLEAATPEKLEGHIREEMQKSVNQVVVNSHPANTVLAHFVPVASQIATKLSGASADKVRAAILEAWQKDPIAPLVAQLPENLKPLLSEIQEAITQAAIKGASENFGNPVIGYANLIGLTQAEHDNVKDRYLPNSNVNSPNEVVAPCKSNNCVAWTSSIELGQSVVGADEDQRNFLFSALGVSRASAHYEISRRLINAANSRHEAVVVFLNGSPGIEAFNKELPKYLPPDPQIPYKSVIKGMPASEEERRAFSVIPDGGKVFIPIAAGASPDGVAALAEVAAGLPKGFDVHMLVNGVSQATLEKAAGIPGDKFRIHALFLGGNLRKLAKEGKAAVIPGYLSDFTRLMRDPQKTDFHYDAIVVRVSPPDAQGRYSLGPNNDMILDVIRNRPGIKIIAEVNPNIPFTTGDNFITEQQITSKFKSESKLAGPPVVPFTQVEANIGQNLAKLIPNEATLQVGIGNIFGGLPQGLAGQRRTGIKVFSEMFSDPLMQAINQGNVVSAETGFAYGSENLYKWLNKNPKVKFVETEYVNNPGRVAQIPNFVAVNTALQVNLRGDVNATHGPDGRRMSSPGGQVEFMSGASRAPNGKAIIAIRSTAKNGELSTITLDNYAGSVTTPHEMVTHVVTEFGTAELQGKSERDRAIALISVAHPKFRPQLIQQAIQRGIIKETDAAKIPLQ